jgi:hypothetical protein
MWCSPLCITLFLDSVALCVTNYYTENHRVKRRATERKNDEMEINFNVAVLKNGNRRYRL